jgi:hypothetical protein
MTYDAGSRGAVGYLEAARELARRGVNSAAAAVVDSGGRGAAAGVSVGRHSNVGDSGDGNGEHRPDPQATPAVMEGARQ